MTDNTATVEKEGVELTEEESRRYELGFHLIPTLPEEEALSVFDSLKEKIITAGGKLIREQAPEKMKLAYSIQKDIDRKRYTYTESHFGWVHFVSDPSAAHALKESLEGDDQILRFLVVKIGEVVPETDNESPVKEEQNSEDEVASEEDLDKEIEKLVDEDGDSDE